MQSVFRTVIRRATWFAASLVVTILTTCAANVAAPSLGRASDGPEVPVADTQQEQLVILDADRVDAALAEIQAVASVTQMLRPRLVLVRADPDVQEGILRIPGVIGLFEAASADVPSELSPVERVFVDAWATRSAPKTRPGEGLDWDAPGFEPPDAR